MTTCGECRWFVPIWATGDVCDGHCRRLAPRESQDGCGRWPAVSPHSWCGEFAAKAQRHICHCAEYDAEDAKAPYPVERLYLRNEFVREPGSCPRCGGFPATDNPRASCGCAHAPDCTGFAAKDTSDTCTAGENNESRRNTNKLAPERDWCLINLNDTIRFRPTPRLSALAQRLGETWRQLPDGRVEMQLWCFMQAFGPHIHMGGDLLVAGNAIEILRD